VVLIDAQGQARLPSLHDVIKGDGIWHMIMSDARGQAHSG